MQTNQPNPHASFTLKDGDSRLAAWIAPMAKRPSLCDTVEIPARFHHALHGFEPRAMVTRIVPGDASPDQIDLEAICRTEKERRPVIVLNTARIGDHRRGDIEAYLRTRLACPLIYWQSCTTPGPVIRFQDPATGAKACPPALQSGILEQIHPSTPLMTA